MTAALVFTDVSKRFTIEHERPDSLQERFVQIFRRRATREAFWVLRDVSFSVRDGETFGILGRNGAGKSTLLKLATGILTPTAGTIARHRRAYAMLELGAGFHPELSGRDNIFLNGSIHGINRATMRALFDQIVAFAEMERFIDTPVKHYSSGMFMRLGFSIAIHMQPELLIIDEILAVGDAAFRRKCMEALWNLRRQGVTIVFVSHDQEAVYQFCDRALLLSEGKVAAIGPVDEVITTYVNAIDAEDKVAASAGLRPLIRSVTVLDEQGRPIDTIQPGSAWAVEIDAHLPYAATRVEAKVTLHSEAGTPVVEVESHDALVKWTSGSRRVRVWNAPFPLPLAAGRLRVTARLTVASTEHGIHVTEHDSPHPITIGGHGHGALLSLPHQWEDLSDPALVNGLVASVGARRHD